MKTKPPKIVDLKIIDPKTAKKDCSQNIAKDISKDLAKDIAKDISKDISKDIAKDISKDIAKDISKDIAKDISKDIAKDISKDIAKDISKDIAKDISKDLACACRAIVLQREAIAKLEESLKSPQQAKVFSATIDDLIALKGRVIVTGMGKSGHIARKIAATLASTGTPAYFVHPAEASHGDLGMIMRNDAVLALSSSGDTEELGNIITYTRRHKILLLAMTARADSSLATQADRLLLMPKVDEACPMGLAPTSSTTIALVYGDALAIALLDRRNFTAQQFHRFHPGGKLGQKLIRVESIMHKENKLPIVRLHSTMREAIIEANSKRLGSAIVCDENNKAQGIITDGDLRRWMLESKGSQKTFETAVEAVMSKNLRTITKNKLVAEGIEIMNANNITALVVLGENEQVVGLLHLQDCLRAGQA